MSVKINHLTKIFGTQKAVDNISLDVLPGEILGFLGPNGAGKSTTMKIITCYLPPTSGSAEVCGYDVVEQPLDVRKNVGYLPEHNPLYTEMYVHEYLEFIGSLHGLNGKYLRQQVKEMVALCGLTVEQNKKIGALSKGYRQRVGLAQALIHDPKVLILDEPTTGLDPNQIVEIRNLIKSMSKEKTVIFSTHIMQEVQALCDRVAIINSGKIVADKAVTNLKETGREFNVITVEFTDRIEVDVIRQIKGVLDVREVSPGKYIIRSDSTYDIRSEIFRFASSNQKTLIGMQQEEDTLEQIFQKLTRDNV